MIPSNRFKYLHKPNLNWTEKHFTTVFNGPNEVVIGLVSTSPSLLQVSHLLIIDDKQIEKQKNRSYGRIQPTAAAVGILLGFCKTLTSRIK